MKTTDFIIKRTKAVVESQPVEAPKVEDFTLPVFTMESAEQLFAKLNESDGGTCSSSVAVVNSVLGEKGGFSKKDVDKKLSGYGNMLTRGGPVKIGKK
jgi:hypothetical protein